MTQETMSFQTEVKELLHLMIHSLYSNKEIFLRELISNSSDAADKLRFESIANHNLYENETNLNIKVLYDKKLRTITIIDNGIGMSREEVIKNLGTIAHSGTKDFFKKLSGDQKKDAALIGQFGVGFYSAFIVSNRVILKTRRAGISSSKGVLWESFGEGEYSIEDINLQKRGTEIILYLRENEDDLLSGWKLKSIIQKYSDHISIPIFMQKEEWDADKKKIIKEDKEEQINQASALWMRFKNDITEDQYKTFYQHLSHNQEEPLIWAHNHVEGNHQYTQLLYIPKHASFDLWNRDYRRGLKLYVKRIFVMDNAEELLPTWLRFIIGIIDSNDLPLNISREILQKNRDIKIIKDGIIKRTLTTLEDLANSKDSVKQEKYNQFWIEFGQVLKEGMSEEKEIRDRITKLMRFSSTRSETSIQNISLFNYIENMKPLQKKIYYLTSDTFETGKNSPHLEIFKKKGIEVILLSDRVDEWMLSFLTKFENKPLQNISKGNLDLELLDDEEKNKKENIGKSTEQLIKKMKEILKDKAKDVRITFRLINSPSCIVVNDDEMSGYLQRMLKTSEQKTNNFFPILEINPEHILIKSLDINNLNFHNWCHIIFDQAMLAEGNTIDNPSIFVNRINDILISQIIANQH